MSVIESKMLQACRRGVAFKGNNTTVNPYVDGRENFACGVYLLGNHIANTTVTNGELAVDVNKCTLKARPTVTTTSRLRALGVDVRIVKGVPYLNGEAV